MDEGSTTWPYEGPTSHHNPPQRANYYFTWAPFGLSTLALCGHWANHIGPAKLNLTSKLRGQYILSVLSWRKPE